MARVQPSKNEILNLRMPKSLKERLEAHAKRMGITPSELGRRGVAVLVDYLDKQEPKQ